MKLKPVDEGSHAFNVNRDDEKSLTELQAPRRRLYTAGNPIGILDQSEKGSLRKSLQLGQIRQNRGSFAPISRSGVHTTNEGRRARKQISVSGFTAHSRQNLPEFGTFTQGGNTS